ncbi:MAG: hypothetical protein WC538_10570 [Thermoanaerobaculia bacterium]|jgi:hypothetical protein
MLNALILALGTLFALSAIAEDYEYVLIPITARNVAGANGSIWRSSLAVTNHSDHDVSVFGIDYCGLALCPPPVLPSKTTIVITAPTGGSYLVSDDLESLTIQLRIQDISRQSETWGTTIPTVRESDALAAPRIASLVEIPVTPEFRSLLRIYDLDRSDQDQTKQVRIRFYAVNPDQSPTLSLRDVLLLETTYKLVPDPSFPPHQTPRMASIPLSTIEQLSGARRLRIEVEAVTDALRFWAFVSVTNNETQHVTIVSP